MSNNDTEKNLDPTPTTEKNKPESGTRFKTHLIIAAGLIVAALAAIPLLDNLSGSSTSQDTLPSKQEKEEELSKATGATGAIGQNNRPLVNEASGLITDASAPSNQTTQPLAPTETPPLSPDTAKTPGIQATKPLTLPAAPAPTEHITPSSKAAQTNKATEPRLTVKQPDSPPPPTPAKVNPVDRTAPLGVPAPPAPQMRTKPTHSADKEAAATATTPAPQSKARPAGSSLGYNVQIGVYNNVTNAQKLLDDLKAKGISNVHSETRVRVGPFNSRSEAEDAIQRLKALGYTTLLTPAGG